MRDLSKRVEYKYGKVRVLNPMIIEAGNKLIKKKFWLYEVKTDIDGEFVSVQRRFRDVVALAHRLR